MKLVSIPNYEKYRVDAIFDCYKWDPQFLDNNTIARHILVITEEETFLYIFNAFSNFSNFCCC